MNIFVCNHVESIKAFQSQLYSLYSDLKTCYVFNTFKDLVASKHDIVGLHWVAKNLDLNGPNVEYLAFHFANHTFLAIYVNPFFGNFNQVT